MKVRFKKGAPLLSLIDPPKVGQSYHVAWGRSNGVVGRILSVDEINKTAIICSPKTRITWKNPVKWSDLRHLRKTQAKINRK